MSSPYNTAPFWRTNGIDDGGPEVTLCNAHAVAAMNVSLVFFDVEPVTTIPDALVFFDAMAAMYGKPPLDLIVEAPGPCDECAALAAEHDAQQATA